MLQGAPLPLSRSAPGRSAGLRRPAPGLEEDHPPRRSVSPCKRVSPGGYLRPLPAGNAAICPGSAAVSGSDTVPLRVQNIGKEFKKSRRISYNRPSVTPVRADTALAPRPRTRISKSARLSFGSPPAARRMCCAILSRTLSGAVFQQPHKAMMYACSLALRLHFTGENRIHQRPHARTAPGIRSAPPVKAVTAGDLTFPAPPAIMSACVVS